MSTTTIRLPEALKARVARAAEAAGTSPHSFILEAIAEKAELAERRADFHALAAERYSAFLETGQSVRWEDARTWLKSQLATRPLERPKAGRQGG